MLRTGDEPIFGYRLDKFLGSGQFGQVWQAQAPGGKLVALKFINIIGKQGLKEYRAIQKVKNIQHPHLMPIIAFWILDQEQNVLNDEVLEQLDLQSQGKEVDVRRTQMGEEPIPNTLVVAMLLGDASLYDEFERCREEGKDGIPVDQLLDYMEEAAKGIDFLNRPCHDLGDGPVAIQHCDIKPHNMLLTGGAVQICDFGLARVLEDVRATRSVAGTPAYIAPESISGRRPSASTDQYSLAISYYEMRTGDLPFADEDRTSQMAIMQAHMKGRLEFALVDDCEADVLRKATSVEPEQRFPTSLAMVRALRRAVEQQQSGPVNLSGTMRSSGFAPPPLSDAAVPAGLFTKTDVTDDPPPVSKTLGIHVDGTLMVSGPAADTLEESNAAAPVEQPLPPEPAEQPRQREGRGRRPSARSPIPILTIAACLAAIAAGVGYLIWGRSDGVEPSPLPPAEVVSAEIHFEPADAVVTINNRPIDLNGGSVALEKPASGELLIQATHASGNWALNQTILWSKLEANDFQVQLPLTAKGHIAQAEQQLAAGNLEQAESHYRQAFELDPARVAMPPPVWLELHGPNIIDMAIDSSGQWLASASDPRNQAAQTTNAFAWQLQPTPPFALATPLPGQEDLVNTVAVSSDGRWLAVGGAGGQVQLWRIGQFDQGAIHLQGVEQDVLDLAFDSSGSYLAAGCYADAVVVWEVAAAAQETAPRFRLVAHKEAVKSLAFIPGTYNLVTAGWDDTVKLWNLPPPGGSGDGSIAPVAMASDIATDINVVAADPQGIWAAAGSGDGVVIWNVSRPAEGQRLLRVPYNVVAMTFAANGKHLAAADADGNVYLWDVTPEEISKSETIFTGHMGAVVALAFSPDNRYLASGGDDKKIRLWDLQSPSTPQPILLEGHTRKVRAILFTPIKNWLLSGDDDGRIGLWDWRRWVVIERARPKRSSVNAQPVIEARGNDLRELMPVSREY